MLLVSIKFHDRPIPWLICTELYPNSVRSLAVSWSTVMNWSMGFLVTMTFTMAKSSMGLNGLFYLYTAVCCMFYDLF